MMKNSILYLMIAMCLSLSAAAQTIVERHGKLHVEGTKIKDECNRDVQLRGMSFFWHQWDNSYAYMNESVITYLRNDWEVQLVRIPIGGRAGDACTSFGNTTITSSTGCNASEAIGKTGRQWAYDVAKRSINAAINAGVYVLIDWHTHDLDVNKAKNFFNQLSAEFGDSPNLIYQIFMEQKNTDWPALKSYSRDVIATIRANDPDNLILVPTPFYNQRLDLAAADPITTDVNGNQVSNMAYILHFYAGAHKEYVRGNAQSALDAGLAVFVAECGRTGVDFNNPNNPIDNASWNTWMDWCDNNKISWASWSMGIKNERSSSLQPSASTDPLNNPWDYNNDLRSEGRYKRDFLRSKNSLPSACTGGGNDDIVSTTVPSSVTPGTNATVTVSYEASTTRDIIVVFQQDTDPWTNYGSALVNVNAGTGSVNVTVPINANTPVANDAYQFQTFITTDGGGWNQRLDNLNKNNIDAVSAGSGLVNGGVYRLKNNYGGLYLAGTNTSGGNVTVGNLNTSWWSQQWILEKVSGSTYRLKCRWGGKYLNNESSGQNGNVGVADLNTGWDSQKWTLENVSSGTYRLKTSWGGRYLTSDANTSGSNVKVHTVNTSWASQQWDLEFVASSARDISDEISLNDDSQKVSVYPNPVSVDGRLFLDMNVTDPLEAHIYSMSGQLMKNFIINQNREIDLENLDAGIYLLKVKNQTLKIAIQ